MTPQSTRYLKLLERRLNLLGKLTEILRQSRADFVSMDLGAMERRIAEQEQICEQIRSIDTEIFGTQTRSSVRREPMSSPASPDDDDRDDEQIRTLLDRIGAAQLELKRINDAHQSMLRHSRRTVQVLMNLFGSFAPTYSVPASPGSTYEERV